jgi:hypothetical protein
MDISKLPTALANMQFSPLNTAMLGIALLVVWLLVSQHFSNRKCAIPLTQEQIECKRTNFYNVAKIPEAPGGLPFIGHLHALVGRRKLDDATVFSQWGAQLNSCIFQIRFGN